MTRRPNILFLLTDDQRFDTIAALGYPHIRTPNLDRLAQRGFAFTNAYCMGSMVGAVCLPSRTMIMTGQSLWRIPPGRGENAPPGTPILPAALKAAGYATFRTGKRGNTCLFANAAFDENNYDDKRDPLSSRRHADLAIDFLRRHKGPAPFLAYVAFAHPHDPRTAPPEYLATYDPKDVPLPKNFLPEHPFDNGELRIRDEMLAPFPRTPDVIRRHLADYYACISFLDAEVGRILEALRQSGRADDTIVIFTSDQGVAIGSHGLMGKQHLYEHVKPPLVFAGPGIPRGRSDALVYLYDLFPTLCEAAGAAVPDAVEGRSLLPLIRGEKPKLRDHVGGAYKDCQRMIRDERWKMLWYPKIDRFQLFDLAADPDETSDLAGRPEHGAHLARLKKALAAWQEEFADPGPRLPI